MLESKLARGPERKHVEDFRKRFSALTSRESQVLGLLVTGHANKQIAAKLKVSTRTVEVHRSHIMRKMGMQTPIELACNFQCAHCTYFENGARD